MLYQKFQLSEQYPSASLTAYVCANDVRTPPRPAVIVCPGGGYSMLSPREAEPVVRKLFGAGLNVYLLKYTVRKEAANYAPLIEAALAIKLVRERAEEDNTDPAGIYILGFSAGGHLAASAGILWNIPEVREALGINAGKAPEGINRPDGMVLCYPVIVGNEYTHAGTLNNFSGTTEPTEEDRRRFSLDLHVDATTPPAFIWHTFTDNAVPVQNALSLMDAMAREKRPFEAHIYPHGVHGLSLCNADSADGQENKIEPHAEGWADLAIKWINYDKKA